MTDIILSIESIANHFGFAEINKTCSGSPHIVQPKADKHQHLNQGFVSFIDPPWDLVTMRRAHH